MRAVWSFWSKPFREYKGRIWREPHHHLLAWGLSLSRAREHYPETVLVTDSAGKTLLVDHLGLDFTHVSTELDRLRDADPGWWALGKLVAYSLQDRPFVHLDTDVFLWRALPSSLTAAPVFAQCPEEHPAANAWCGPGEIESLFARHGHPLPVEWEWACSRGGATFREENCGILGGNDVTFLRYFANLAIDLAMNPAYAGAWRELAEKSGFNMILEQYLLAACIDYHRSAPDSPYRGVRIRYLFPNWGEAYSPSRSAQAGFTHLLGDAKSDFETTSRLEQRMAATDPAFDRHCRRVAQSACARGI
jgi:hypothetical protein